jgi:hypothetical protein
MGRNQPPKIRGIQVRYWEHLIFSGLKPKIPESDGSDGGKSVWIGQYTGRRDDGKWYFKTFTVTIDPKMSGQKLAEHIGIEVSKALKDINKFL